MPRALTAECSAVVAFGAWRRNGCFGGGRLVRGEEPVARRAVSRRGWPSGVGGAICRSDAWGSCVIWCRFRTVWRECVRWGLAGDRAAARSYETGARMTDAGVSREIDDPPLAQEARRAVEILNPSGEVTMPRPARRRVICVANQKGGVG